MKKKKKISSIEPLGSEAIWPIVRCYRWLIACVSVLGGLAGFYYGSSQTPQFTSFASVLIQPQRGASAAVAEATGAGLELSSGTLEAEIRLIQSPRFLMRLIDDLKLRQHADFLDPESEEFAVTSLAGEGFERIMAIWDELADQGLYRFMTIWHELAGYLGYASQTIQKGMQDHLARRAEAASDDANDAARTSSYDLEQDPAFTEIVDRLVTEPQADAYLISIGYVSSDPLMSAQVANYAAELYVDWKLDEKLSSVETESRRLTSRLGVIRQQLIDAENEVERFKRANSLLATTQGGLVVDEELIAIKRDFKEARADLASELERYKLLLFSRNTDQSFESIVDRDATQRITQLRSEHTTLVRTKAESAITLGPKHPRMVALNAELEELNAKISVERDRIIDAQKANAQLALKRAKGFMRELGRLHEASAGDRQLQVESRELERKAAAKREFYQALLARFQRTDQERGGIKADARIVSNALVPQRSSTPSPISFALVGLVGSMSLTTFFVLLTERFREGFTKVSQTESELGLKVLGTLPITKKAPAGALWTKVTSSPSSQFAEAFGGIYTSLMLNRESDDEAFTVLVTSSVPTEGKTTLSSCLAAYAAKTRPDQRVLVIDLDFRQPTIRSEFGSADQGLVEFLTGEPKVDLADVLQKTPVNNLDYLPIRSTTHNSTLLMSSKAMEHFIRLVKPDYDLIVLDCPPVLPINDTKIAVKWTDACLFAVKWSATARETVRTALNQLADIDVPIAGVVFTHANMRRYNKYNYLEGGKYYESYKRYYTPQ